MALIKCPECGRENVSDTAPTCPECGYAIREYFEKIEQEKLAQEQQIQQQKQAEETRKCDEENKIQSEKRRIESVRMPDKPKFPLWSIVCGGICFLLGGSSAFTATELEITRSMARGNGNPVVQGTILIIFGFVLLGIGVYLYSKKLSEYNLALSSFEVYRKQKLKEEEEAKAQAERNYQRQVEAAKNAPKCPSCKSSNVKPISTASRVVSVGMVGLASSKIGKTMECKNCGYKW